MLQKGTCCTMFVNTKHTLMSVTIKYWRRIYAPDKYININTQLNVYNRLICSEPYSNHMHNDNDANKYMMKHVYKHTIMSVAIKYWRLIYAPDK